MIKQYMIRKKFYIPKSEQSRDYRMEGDLRSCDFIVSADLPEDVSMEVSYESLD